MNINKNSLDKLIIVGDRVLIKPKSHKDQTKSGLFLPPGVQEKEKIQSGYILKVGPGYPLPVQGENYDEPWKPVDEKVKYIPLQVQEGDLAIFLQKSAFEVMYENERYFIVPQHSILMVERDEELFN
ncbi:MAG: chaperonin [Thalassobius sp.]|nr:chaperonin [Thalassovita sp.]|tara:strand:- start:576 stop:956 length:381 start_codon:yes stop_codon:yes gene_type:complete